jgi:hypothetical protein
MDGLSRLHALSTVFVWTSPEPFLALVLDRLMVLSGDALVGRQLVTVDRGVVAHGRVDESLEVVAAAVRDEPKANLAAALDYPGDDDRVASVARAP